MCRVQTCVSMARFPSPLIPIPFTPPQPLIPPHSTAAKLPSSPASHPLGLSSLARSRSHLPSSSFPPQNLASSISYLHQVPLLTWFSPLRSFLPPSSLAHVDCAPDLPSLLPCQPCTHHPCIGSVFFTFCFCSSYLFFTVRFPLLIHAPLS